MSYRFKILSCAYSFSAFDLYELNVINLIILFCIVFIVLSKYVHAEPQLLIPYWRKIFCLGDVGFL